MTLDVEPPEPPLLRGGVVDEDGSTETGDGRRDHLGDLLREGAWSDGFHEWADDTHLTTAEYSILREHGLTERIDLRWDAADERVRYAVPELPPGALEAVDHESGEELRAALDALADVVATTLETEYLPREAGGDEFWAGDTSEEFREGR